MHSSGYHYLVKNDSTTKVKVKSIHDSKFSAYGQSQSKLSLLKNSKGQYYVKKSAGGVSPERLRRQIDKHKLALDNFCMNPVSVPQIFNEYEDDGYAMEYIYGELVGDYIEICDSDELIEVSEKILSYFERNYNSCAENKVVSGIQVAKMMQEKLDKCEKNLNDNWLSRKIRNRRRDLFDIFKECDYRSGWNHGDFSFENILITNNRKVFVFDFLDSPVDLPLIDWGRFWLDVNYGWWAQRENNTANANLNMKKFQSQILKKARELSVSEFELNKFALFAALRVLPYTKKPLRKGHLSYVTNEILDTLLL